jgi:C1A family cysteine protease
MKNLTYHIEYIMNKAIVLTLALAFVTTLLLSHVQKDRTPSEMFEEWRNKHGLMLHLTSSELAYRVRIFEKNLKEIEAHNANSAHTYKQGVNQFTAYSQEEFEAMFLSKIEAHSGSAVTVEEPLKDGISIDWVTAGAVSPVKNQGSCTATYAFSAVGGIEGVSAIFFKQQTEYSVQQLIDCSGSYGNSGCSSGTMVNSYNYILTKGISPHIQESKQNWPIPTGEPLAPARPP